MSWTKANAIGTFALLVAVVVLLSSQLYLMRDIRLGLDEEPVDAASDDSVGPFASLEHVGSATLPEEAPWGRNNFTNYSPKEPIFISNGCGGADWMVTAHEFSVQPIWIGPNYDEYRRDRLSVEQVLEESLGIQVLLREWVRMVDSQEAWRLGDDADKVITMVVDPDHSFWNGQTKNYTGESPYIITEDNVTRDKVIVDGVACGDTVILNPDYPCIGGLIVHEFGHVLGLDHSTGGVMDNTCHRFFTERGKLALDSRWSFCERCGPWWNSPTYGGEASQ